MIDKKEIGFEDRRKIQLDILIEVDAFCRANDIKYSLAYGTLIGAIRHQGFIPWDDDVDIMMPFPDMQKFKALFKSEKYEYIDVDNDKTYKCAFSCIASKETYCKDGLIANSHGVCIDLYPVLGLPSTEDGVNSFFNSGQKKQLFRINVLKWHSRIVRYLPIKYIWGFNRVMKDYRDFIFQYPYINTTYYLTFGGGLHWRNVVNYNLFENLVDVDFEGKTFSAISDYDKWLTHFYGDYMKLPPEDQRVPYHGQNYYWN